MSIPPQLHRVHGIQGLQQPDLDVVNVRLPLFDVTAGDAAASAVAADVLPRLAGAHRARAERDAPPVFDLLRNDGVVRHGVRAPSLERILAADQAVPGLLAEGAPPYTGPVDVSSPIGAPIGPGPNGTPMTVEREPVDILHPMGPGLQAVQVLQPPAAAMPVTPPRGADGRISSEVIFVVNRTVQNLELR